MATKYNAVELFKKVPLFSSIGGKELEYLAGKSYEKTCEKDNIILQRGEKSGILGILISGQLKVTMLSLQGREITLAILTPYSFIGEMSLLDDEPHSATVMTLKKSKLLIVSQNDFHDLLKANPDVCLYLLKTHVKLVRKLSDRIADLKFMDIFQRTAKKLVDMYVTGNEEPIEITHQELANLVGSNRENVTRALNEIEKRELTYMKKGQIVIKDLEGLKDIFADFM